MGYACSNHEIDYVVSQCTKVIFECNLCMNQRLSSAIYTDQTCGGGPVPPDDRPRPRWFPTGLVLRGFPAGISGSRQENQVQNTQPKHTLNMNVVCTVTYHKSSYCMCVPPLSALPVTHASYLSMESSTFNVSTLHPFAPFNVIALRETYSTGHPNLIVQASSNRFIEL